MGTVIEELLQSTQNENISVKRPSICILQVCIASIFTMCMPIFVAHIFYFSVNTFIDLCIQQPAVAIVVLSVTNPLLFDQVYCEETKIDYSDYVPMLLKGVIHLFIDEDTVVLEAAWNCLNSITKVNLKEMETHGKCTGSIYVADDNDNNGNGSKTVQPTCGWPDAAQRSTNCTHPSCPPQWGPVSTVFWAGRPSGLAGWLPLLLLEAADVETNPGPKHTRTQVWICDICHREINRKQTSLRCNHSEHWVRLRCAHIRVDQYTDTWICHLHRGSRLPHATHTSPHFPIASFKPLLHSHPPHLTPNTNIHQTRRRPPPP